MDPFKRALKNKQNLTKLIHELYKLALEVNDYPAQVMLDWFIEEQLELAGDSGPSLLIMDRKLGERAE